MTTLTVDDAGLRATSVLVTDDALSVELIDGRSLSVPIVWYPRLRHSTPAERNNFEFIDGGSGIHWPDLDEDISISADSGSVYGVETPAGVLCGCRTPIGVPTSRTPILNPL